MRTPRWRERLTPDEKTIIREILHTARNQQRGEDGPLWEDGIGRLNWTWPARARYLTQVMIRRYRWDLAREERHVPELA